MSRKTTVEVVVLVDAAGNHSVGLTREAAVERYEEEVGELSAAEGVRYFHVSLTVPLPTAVTLSGEVDEADEPAVLHVT